MYLVELDNKGLVRVDGEFDGINAINEFRAVIKNEDLGVVCFTAIALTVDYLTPIKYYKDEDRPFKAMEIASGGNRKAFVWNQDLIQSALLKYDELQYNPTIEEKRTLDSLLLDKLKEISDQKNKKANFIPLEEVTEENLEQSIMDNSDIKRLLGEKDFTILSPVEKKSLIRKANIYVVTPYNQKRQDEQIQKEEERLMLMFKQLATIKTLLENFNKANENNDIYSEGPVRNGYKLSRLEEKALNENSFYHKSR